MNVCMYLRKSRADEELEKEIGEFETLQKHKKALMKYAKANNLNIIDIKEELVSGESILHRPKMIELLKEVENKKYNGVLVMDIDRLGRGGMRDQGIILEAFKESKTLIITPSKTYNLDNETDEEMTEFKAFFARRELKSINKRMQGGRIRSVEEGNYISTNPPLGYDIDFIKRSRTLKVNESEAEIVKLIFSMYVEGNGSRSIADFLNNLGHKTKVGNKFSPSSVLFIIKNPCYIGKITWKKKDIRKSTTLGKVKDTRTREKSEWIIVDGKHKPIIDVDTFEKAQKIVNGKYHSPYQLIRPPVNPIAGIGYCGVCGKALVMRPSRGIYRLMCVNKCGNASTRFDLFENDLIEALEQYVENYEYISTTKTDDSFLIKNKNLLRTLSKELTTLNEQRTKLFDFLERGLYTEDVFLERMTNLNSRIENVNTSIDKVKAEIIKEENTVSKDIIITFKNAIEGYKKTNDVKNKNKLLKSILYKVEYFKEKNADKNDFTIKLYPRLDK